MDDDACCDNPGCPCHAPGIEPPPHVVARIDQTLAAIADQQR